MWQNPLETLSANPIKRSNTQKISWVLAKILGPLRNKWQLKAVNYFHK